MSICLTNLAGTDGESNEIDGELLQGLGANSVLDPPSASRTLDDPGLPQHTQVVREEVRSHPELGGKIADAPRPPLQLVQ